jgi:sulfur-oxidizing protein SoxY
MRRTFLRIFLNGGMLLTATLSVPSRVWAMWSEAAFRAIKIGDAMNELLASDKLKESDRITLKIPEIAENGAVVPVTIKTDLPAVESISIFSEKNAYPLLASFTIPDGTTAFVSTRVKLAESTLVIAVVKSEGTLYCTRKDVKVIIGGCNG